MSQVSISDAEWQVMNVVWSGQPLTAQEVIGNLEDQSAWAPATVKTMLHRLVKKNVLAYEPQGNRYVYRSRARRSDCVRQASRSFLERVFGGESASEMIPGFRVRRRIAARGSPERRLIDDRHLRERLTARNRVVLACGFDVAGPQPAGERTVHHVMRERALARAARPGDGAKHTERDFHVHAAQVVLACVRDRERVPGPPRCARTCS